jgi:hypothetical protein
MYNRRMMKRLLIGVAAVVFAAGCARSRDVQKDLKIVDVHTGWYDMGIVEGRNKLVPSISLKLENVSSDDINNVQMNAVFHQGEEQQAWGDQFVMAIDRNGLKSGATGTPIVLRSMRGYTGDESRADMLKNSQFIDARVQIFGKHGSNTWAKMGEFPIDRKLLTNQ